MTFKIKNHQLNNRAFYNALKELGNAAFDSSAVSWNVKRMLRQFDKALDAAGAKYAETVNKYCMKDDKGKIVQKIDEEGNEIPNSFQFENEEIEGKFGDEMKDFMGEEYTIESYKLKPEDFAGAKLSATDLAILEPIIDEEE